MTVMQRTWTQYDLPVCISVQMSDTGSDAENMDPVPDNTVREPPKEPEPAPKRRRLGKLQRAK